MTECLDFLSRDESCALTEMQKKNILSYPDAKGRVPVNFSTVVRINGGTVMQFCQLGTITDKYSLKYARMVDVIKRLDLAHVDSDEADVPCDQRIAGEKVVPDNNFWKEIHEKHMSIDGDKIKEAPYKYDLNASVYVNGYLIYNGWFLFGSSEPTTKRELPQFVRGLILDAMSKSTTRPTNDELDIIFGDKK